MHAIYQALGIMDRWQESGHRYTGLTVSTAAIERIRTDSIGPGQRFAIATIEVCTRLLARDNEVATHWVPAHHGVPGNEEVDEFAKAAVEGAEPDSAVPDECWPWREISLSHMTRVATEARSRSTAQWTTDHVGPQRKYRSSRGKGVKRGSLRRVQKSIVSRYYQLLSGHAAIGPYLKDRVRKADDDRR